MGTGGCNELSSIPTPEALLKEEAIQEGGQAK